MLPISIVLPPHFAVIFDGFLFAFCAGSFTIQRPSSPTIAVPTFLPLSATSTFAPFSPTPHTGASTSRCSTILSLQTLANLNSAAARGRIEMTAEAIKKQIFFILYLRGRL